MAEDRPPRDRRSGPPPERPLGEVTTRDLLVRYKEGDRQALDQIYKRHLEPLRRYARGRLPQWARDAVDTDDLVQQTLLDTLKRIDAFEPRFNGALQAYARQALNNRIRDEVQRARRKPQERSLDSGAMDQGPSPLDQAAGHEAYARYRAALERLGDEAREAVTLRIEMGFKYDEIAAALGKPSANAARMTVTRALVRLAKEMGDGK